MSNPKSTTAQGADRFAPRVEPSGLTTSIRRWGVIPISSYQPCQLQNISPGGIGIETAGLSYVLHEKVELRLLYRDMRLDAEGVVVHKSFHNGICRYGILFLTVCEELDTLIDFFLRQVPADVWDQPERSLRQSRRGEPRYVMEKLSVDVQVHKLLGRSEYLDCPVNDVSMSGISFITHEHLTQEIPFKAKIELVLHSKPYTVDGWVCNYRITERGYCYGVEYQEVPEDFARATKQLLSAQEFQG